MKTVVDVVLLVTIALLGGMVGSVFEDIGLGPTAFLYLGMLIGIVWCGVSRRVK